MTTPSLLPCPFCGGAAAFRWCGGVMLAECTACHTSKGDDGGDDFHRSAAEKWNRRYVPSETAASPGDIVRSGDIFRTDTAKPLPDDKRPAEAAPSSSIDYQQRRGMLADAVDWAILEYDEFMKDDAYDAQAVLDRIINRLREVRDILNGK